MNGMKKNPTRKPWTEEQYRAFWQKLLQPLAVMAKMEDHLASHPETALAIGYYDQRKPDGYPT
jgi:hypothetical protein